MNLGGLGVEEEVGFGLLDQAGWDAAVAALDAPEVALQKQKNMSATQTTAYF